MVRSAPARLAAMLLVAAADAGCSAGAASRPAADLSSVPVAWTAAGPHAEDSTAVLWVFRTEDCLSCVGVDYDIRRVQARFGRAVPLIAVHVGSDADSVISRACLRTRRVNVDHAVRVSPRAFLEMYPGAALPGLYLLRGRKVAWSAASATGVTPERVQLDTLVQRLRQGLAPASGRELENALHEPGYAAGISSTRIMKEAQ